ncbi:MAG TPA: FAD-binding oxidoreductase [Geminicoccaceae bacterium]|nr:FAD-binding oxidoreductase [Geminicoccaceae bacterium]
MGSMGGHDGALRVAVIGAGIVGTSCAFFLQRDGHAVTLIDPLEPGAGTSSGNAGVISLGSCLPVGTSAVLRQVPAMLRDPLSPLSLRWRHLVTLAPWLWRFVLASRPGRIEALSRAIVALVREADRAHDIVIQRCGLGGLVRTGGWLKVARDARRFEAATAAEREALERHGLEFEVLDRAAVHALEPALAPDVAHGLLLPRNRAVRHPERYVQGIARTFVEQGGVHLRARALDLAWNGGRAAGVRTEAGEVAADRVVLAAGAFSKRLARSAGIRLPLEAERGYHVMLPHPEPTLRRPVYPIEGGFVLAPMEHGIRLTGGVELASVDAAADWRRIRALVPRARALLPGLGEEILSEWLGFRPSLPDSLPVIGPAPGRAGLYFAFGHQHIGLTLGPLTGRLIADLVAGRDPGLDLAPYAPDRRFW